MTLTTILTFNVAPNPTYASSLILQNTYQTTLTIEGRGIPQEHLERQRTRLRQTDFQPTGFFVNEGEQVVIHVSGAVNNRVFAAIGVPEMGQVTEHPLRQGRNEIVTTHDGILNLMNRNPEGHVQIVIESALDKIPFFILGKTTNADWEQMMSQFSEASMVQLKSDRALISVRYSSAERFIEDATELMKYYDQYIRAQDRIAGEVEGDRGIHGTNPNYYHHVEADKGYMFATHGHLGYHGDHALIRLLRTDNGWGPWHETRHQRQQNPWTWSAVVEATVNIYSLAAQEGVTGHASELDNHWSEISQYLARHNKVFNDESDWVKLGMFWQLHLTFGEDFYPTLHQRYRAMDLRLHPRQDAEKLQSFMIETSMITQLNLLPFFEMWGFPIDPSTRDQLRHLSILNQPIWENQTSHHITIDMPDYEVEIPQLVDQLSEKIKEIRVVENQFHIDIDREFHEGINRIIFDVNDRYTAETFNGITYYASRVAMTHDTVTIRLNQQVNIGDTLTIRLSTGVPGQASNALEYIDVTYTQDGVTLRPTEG